VDPGHRLLRPSYVLGVALSVSLSTCDGIMAGTSAGWPFRRDLGALRRRCRRVTGS
jgi:hypothetical protein